MRGLVNIEFETTPEGIRTWDYQLFAGLDVDKHSIAATLCNHEELLRSLRLLLSAAQLLNYVRKHFPQQRQPLSEPLRRDQGDVLVKTFHDAYVFGGIA